MKSVLRTLQGKTTLASGGRCVRFRSTAQSTAARNEFASAKPFTDIPTKKGYPVVNNIFEFLAKPGKAHEIVYKRHEQYGPIFREKAGVYDAVFISDASALGDFLRQEGKYPKRTEMQIWKKYREISGEADGVLTA